MSHKFIKKNRGFTLVELIVVIAIIGILVAIVIIAINPVQTLAKTKDTKSRTEINQIKTSLQLYYNDCRSYPDSLPWGLAMTYAAPACAVGATYMNQVPNKNNYGYRATPAGCTTANQDCTSYFLGARLSYPNTDDLASPNKCTGGAGTQSVTVNNPAGTTLTITNDPLIVAPNTGKDNTVSGGGLAACPD